MHAKYEVSFSYCSKVIANVEVDNRQTDKHTDKQTDQTGQKNMPRSLDPGHKNVVAVYMTTFKL